MSRMDDALREALRRRDPGEDFTRRVLAAVSATPEPGRLERLFAAFRLPAVRWATAACLAVAAITGTAEYRERRARAEGEAAKEKLMVAMRITGAKLRATQAKVLEITER